MSRPFGVTAIAVLLFGSSIYLVWRALPHLGGVRNRGILVATCLLAVLALIATEALWSLRSHAFLTFVLWGLCAIATMALLLLKSPAGAHAVRIIPTLVYTGLVFAAVALYLRRAI